MDDKMLKVLLNLIEKLESNHIFYLLGGSGLLYFHGIVDKVADIDLMICEEDAERTATLLRKIGRAMPNESIEEYGTTHFSEYLIDGVEVDLIAGFTIVKDNERYYFPVNKNADYPFAKIGATKVRLDLLSNWQTYYEMMDRMDKSELIKAFLKS